MPLLLRFVAIAALAGLAVSQATNVARTGTATQSSTRMGGGAAGRAIDGNTDGVFINNSVTHTDAFSNVASWWQVALKSPQLIHEIRIWNRTDCCSSRLSNFKVIASLGTATMFNRTYAGTVSTSSFLGIDLGSGIVCDRVRIELIGTPPRILSLAEVEVLRYARPVLNLARWGRATQSTTANGGVASRAIDGNYNRVYNANSVTHTDDKAGSWWQVELAWRDTINRIELYNRGDCCGNRLSNFRVSVLLGTVEVWGKDYYTTTGSVPQGQVHGIDVPKGTIGDRVRVALKGLNRANNYALSLAEVEVQRFGAALAPDVLNVKNAAGSKQKLALDAGRSLAGQSYLLVGSLTGTYPGISFGSVTVPLNIDAYFYWTLQNPTLPPLSGSRGKLDTAGRGKAEFTFPNGAPNLVGLKLYHAYAVVGKAAILDAASNPVLLEIVK